MKYYYYEIIGGELFELDPEVLFIKKKGKGEIPLYRQMMMYYRREVLKLHLTPAAKRYGRDHATVLHAIKTVRGYKDVDPIFKMLFERFMYLCDLEVKRRMAKEEPLPPSISLSPDYIDALKNRFSKRMDVLKYYLGLPRDKKSYPDELINQIDICVTDLNFLKEYYTIYHKRRDEFGNKANLGESGAGGTTTGVEGSNGSECVQSVDNSQQGG